MNGQRNNRQRLVLNTLPLDFDQRARLRIGRLPFEGRDEFNVLRDRLAGTHVIRRRGAHIEVVGLREDGEPVGEMSDVAAGNVTDLVSALLTGWLVDHFAGLGREVLRRRRALVLLSSRPEDDLLRQVLPRWTSAPTWLGLRRGYELEVRVQRTGHHRHVLLTINSVTRPWIDASVAELIEKGVSVRGIYVRRPSPGGDKRLVDTGRLTGRVLRVDGDTLVLSEYDEDWPSIHASDAKLEPRIEVLAHVAAALQGRSSQASSLLDRFRESTGLAAAGAESLS